MSIIYGNLLAEDIRAAIEESKSELLKESLKDLKDGAPYTRAKGEFKRMLKNLFKKKKKENKSSNSAPVRKIDKMNEDEKKEYLDQMDKDYQELLKTIEKSISKIKTTKEFKDKCVESSKKANEYIVDSEEPFIEGYIPPLKAFDFEDDGYGNYIIEVIDDCQVIAITYNWILYDIVDYIKENFSDVYRKWGFDYGDGDEGCLYVDYVF